MNEEPFLRGDRMFDPDKPIQSQKEDILDRASFAQSLGDAILKYKEKDSIVIGLFGAWGSGKTSIVNMALKRVQSVTNSEHKPVIVNFNPWNFSDQNQLIGQFFDQLSSTLGRKDCAQRCKRVGGEIKHVVLIL